MVKYSEARLDGVFSALADPTRREVLRRLARQEATVSELAQGHELSLPGMMKHLDVLESAALISTRKEGRRRVCRAEPESLRQAQLWISETERFWTNALTALDSYLKTELPQ